MNIGEASAASGISAKMIRYYESIGLLRPAARLANTYRQYSERDIHELRFIGRARSLGFSMSDIANLLSLWQDRKRSSSQVKKIAGQRLAELDTRIAEMQAMASTLRELVAACHGDARPECPILADIASLHKSGAKANHGKARFV